MADNSRGIPMGYAEAAADMAPDASARALREALEAIRSGLRNLPASATAVMLDEIAAAALASAAPAAPPPEASYEQGVEAAAQYLENEQRKSSNDADWLSPQSYATAIRALAAPRGKA